MPTESSGFTGICGYATSIAGPDHDEERRIIATGLIRSVASGKQTDAVSSAVSDSKFAMQVGASSASNANGLRAE